MVCGEAELELLSLRHCDGDLLDLEKHLLVCSVCLHGRSANAVDAPVVDLPPLERRFAIGLQPILNIAGDLVEQGDSSGRVWQGTLVGVVR